MEKKGLGAALLAGVFTFYILIIMYIFFAVIHIETLKNFEVAVAYQIIGFGLLAYFLFGQTLYDTVKAGYFVPLVIATIIYMIALSVINIVCVAFVPQILFFLIHLVLLFFYCLVSVPMYIMGRNIQRKSK